MSSEYSNVIQSIANNTDQSVGKNADPKSYLEALQFMASSSMAESARFKKLMNDSLNNQVKEYNQTSEALNTYNQMYVNNNYINDELSAENKKIDAMVSEFKRKIYASKQKSQNYIYIANKTVFTRTLVLYTVLLSIALLFCIRMALGGLFTETTMYVMMGVFCLIYAGFMSWYVVRSSYRTKYDWTKFYWTGPMPGGGDACPAQPVI
jgi:hypothetical protein